LTVKKAHDLAEHLEGDIKDACPNINLIIHVEPS
jgi:divalent metal cation (Fe/Co/Zn/Cd) transporter